MLCGAQGELSVIGGLLGMRFAVATSDLGMPLNDDKYSSASVRGLI